MAARAGDGWEQGQGMYGWELRQGWVGARAGDGWDTWQGMGGS